MKLLSPALSLAVLLVAAFVWLTFVHDPMVRRQALLRDSLATALADVDSTLVREAAKDSEYALSQIVWTDELNRLRRQLGHPRVDVDTVTLTDTVEVRAALETLETENQTCRDALTACDSLNLVVLGRVAVRDSMLAAVRPAYDRLRELWDARKDRKWGIGAACGLAGNQHGFGPGCTLGFVYRF